jgi:hypothetical protein
MKKGYLFAVLMIFVMGLTAQTPEGLDLIARWASGPCRAIFATGDAWYMGNGSYLDILNATNPANRYSRYEFPGLIQDITYQSFKIYVAVKGYGVFVLNSASVQNPTLEGQYQTQGDSRRLVYQNGTIYLADGSGGFKIIQASPLESMAAMSFSHSVQDVAVSGDYAFLAVDKLGLISVDISNPSNPVARDTADTPGEAYGVSVRGNMAFVADRSQGVWAVDITSPQMMDVTGQWTTEPNSIHLSDITLDIGAETAYLSDEGYGLRVIDLTNMTQKTALNTGGDAFSLFIDQNYVYLADGTFGLKKIDVAVVPPDQVDSVISGGEAKDVIFTPDYCYVAGGEGGIWILDHESLHDGQVSMIVHWDTDNAQGLAIKNSVLMIADGPGGLLFYNITNPASPQYVTRIQTAGEMLDVTVLGDFAYVAEGNAGLRRVNVANPLEPVNQGLLEGTNTFRSVGVTSDARSNRIYIAADTDGLKVYDVNSLSVAGTYQNDSHIQSVGVPEPGSNTVYVADGENGLRRLNVANVQEIVSTGTVNTEGTAYDVDFLGDMAVVADGAGTIRLIDISDEEILTETGSYHTVGVSYAIDVYGDTLVIADGDGGVYYLKAELIGELQVLADSLHFGAVVLGKNRTLWMNVENTGTASVNATSLTSNSGRFYAGNLPMSIPAGEKRSIPVTFTPNAYTTFRDTLRLNSSAANTPHSLIVIGEGVQAIPLEPYTSDYYTYSLYRMDALEGTLLPDESTYGLLDGVVTGAILTQGNGGRFNEGLIFDSNDIVTVDMAHLEQHPALQARQGFTVETWFKLSQIIQTHAVLYQLTEDGNLLFELGLLNNRLVGMIRRTDNAIDTLWSNPEFTLSVNTWYHGALSLGSMVGLYLNGQVQETRQIQMKNTTGQLAATVGNDASREHSFRGVLDEMRVSGLERQPWEFNVSTGRIQVSTQAVSFGGVYVGRYKYYYLYLYNQGAGPLYVEDLHTLTDHFSVYDSDFTIASGGYRAAYIRFTPDAVRSYLDTLVIISQDLIQPELRIPLMGTGFQTVNLSAYSPDIYTSGLWHLDGSTGMDSIPDASGNSLIGYFRGSGISWYTLFKKFGSSSLYFTGDTSWIWLPYNALFDYTSNPFSLETWFGLAGRPAAGKDFVLFRRGTGNATQYEILYGDSTESGRGLIVRFYGANNQVYTLYGPPDSQMSLEAWYQMAVTWDHNKFRLYLNGVPVDSADFTGTLRASSGGLSMGGDFGSGRGFNGYLDEIRFSNIDRQPEEFNIGIPDIYTQTKSVDFDTVFVGSSGIAVFNLSNAGTLSLQIDSLNVSLDIFSFNPSSGNLQPNETMTVTGSFSPDTTGIFQDTLVVYSNDPDEPVLRIPIVGLGIDYRPKEPYALDAYTVALYHCDSTNPTTVADATGIHNGTLFGSRVSPAYFSGGLLFNGMTDYLTIADSPALQFDMSTQSFTVECFFKTDTVNQTIFFKDPYQAGGNARGNYGLTITSEGVLALHGFGHGSVYVADGVWHHAAFVYNGTLKTGILYLDGSLELHQAWNTGDTDVNNPGNLLFGARELSANQRTGYFQGEIDEIRISNIARPPWDLIFKGTGISVTSSDPTRLSQHSVAITIPDRPGEETVLLHYRRGGQRIYQTLQATKISDTAYQAIIPAQEVTERGLEYWVELNGSGKTWTHPLYDPLNRPLIRRVLFNQLSADTTLKKNQYMMVSVPADLNDTHVGSVLSDDLGLWDPFKWRCLAWKDTMYWEYDDTLTYGDSLVFSFDQGNAFWLITDSDKSWDVGAGISVSTMQPFHLMLRPQWNMIGSPFPFPVAWNDCALTSDSLETLYYYNGKGYRLDWPVLDPWAGYWMYNAGMRYKELVVPPREPAVLTKAAPVRGGVCTDMAETDWIWQISARSTLAEDLDNYLGARQSSLDGWDFRDRSEPPPLGDYLALYFDHSDWPDHAGPYAADIRKSGILGFTWNMEVETRLKQTPVTLNAFLHQVMPEHWQIRMVDTQGEVAIDISQNEYTFISDESVPNIRHFKVIAGPPEFVNQQVQEAMKPVQFHLYQNYPNPFNPETTIRYTLPSGGKVILTVFNMLGQRVATLVNTEQVQGEYEVRWSGISDRGVALSTGVYFYRLEFPGRVAIRKMILVR